MDQQQSSSDETIYRIEQVAHLLDITKRTIRYYEELGLLPPPERTESNYRLYSQQDVLRLQRIIRFKNSLGLSLNEIREMLTIEEERDDIRQAYQQSQDNTERLVNIDKAEDVCLRQLAVVDKKMQQLHELHEEIEQRLQRLARLRADYA